MKINTINIVQIIDNVVQSIESYSLKEKYREQSIKEAEAIFEKILKENNVNENEIENYLDNGYYETGSQSGGIFCVNLVWS